jgi:hypothetical protein
MKYLILLLAMVTATVQAEVYKSINADGEVVYSDTPSKGSERVKLPALPSYEPPPATPGSGSRQAAQDNDLYESFSFIKPVNDATVRNNLGIVMIEARLTPALLTKLKHRIQFYLDGEPYGPTIDRTAVTMSNLDRGEHVLSASVMDTDGTVLISTGDTVVHVKRQSKLFDKEAGIENPIEPPPGEGDGPSPNVISDTPNLLSETPGVRTSNPNLRSANPNLRSTTPNIISPPPPAPAQ